ncbi:MAG TPA: phosphate ABC transporter permease subunit PstC [Methanotrichaceae archaeon]|nr:phosphate ABC transporter permease subunit PstC [Methanotrichaceae archaeon]
MGLLKGRSLALKRRYGERSVETLLFLSAIISILAMLMIFYFLVRESVNAFSAIGVFNLIAGTRWNAATDTYGMLPLIVNSLLVTILALIINMAIGIPLAIYMAELAGPMTRTWLKPAIELLAGVPSIVYGFLGVLILVSYLQDTFQMLTGRSILAGSILLGIMFIPSITTICEDALRAVPSEFKEGSMALGANQWQTIRHVTIPAASSGITAAILLNIGRIIGETMAVLLVVGNVARIPTPIFDVFDRGATFTSVIASEMGEVPHGSLHYYTLFAVGLVLLVLVSLMSVIADLIRERIQRKFGGY